MINNSISEILNIHKPVGITSYDVVRKVKKILKLKKIGHGGTLDPFAEGVLLILIGKATKKMNQLLSLPKSYEAEIKLGQSTDTADHTGEITDNQPVLQISEQQIQQVINMFHGEVNQTPPQYSAKKINGIPAYKLARQGIEFTLNPVKINIYDLKIVQTNHSILKINTSCSSGTYVRVLGEDIAKKFGTVGHLVSLKRTCIGDYKINNSLLFDNLEKTLMPLKTTILSKHNMESVKKGINQTVKN